jgi:hypothetical protein
MVRLRSRTAAVALTVCVVAVLAGVAGWLASRSEVAVPLMVRAYLLQDVVGQSRSHPASSFDWVEVTEPSLVNWESAHQPVVDIPGPGPRLEFYVVELRGQFGPFPTNPPYPEAIGPSKETGAVEVLVVATHTTGSPNKKGVRFFTSGWLSKSFVPLSTLGQVNKGAIPKSPKLTNGRVPDLVGLNYIDNSVELKRLAPSFKYQQIARYDPYLPIWTIVAQTPEPGQHRRGGVVTITVDA